MVPGFPCFFALFWVCLTFPTEPTGGKRLNRQCIQNFTCVFCYWVQKSTQQGQAVDSIPFHPAGMKNTPTNWRPHWPTEATPCPSLRDGSQTVRLKKPTAAFTCGGSRGSTDFFSEPRRSHSLRFSKGCKFHATSSSQTGSGAAWPHGSSAGPKTGRGWPDPAALRGANPNIPDGCSHCCGEWSGSYIVAPNA